MPGEFVTWIRVVKMCNGLTARLVVQQSPPQDSIVVDSEVARYEVAMAGIPIFNPQHDVHNTMVHSVHELWVQNYGFRDHTSWSLVAYICMVWPMVCQDLANLELWASGIAYTLAGCRESLRVPIVAWRISKSDQKCWSLKSEKRKNFWLLRRANGRRWRSGRNC